MHELGIFCMKAPEKYNGMVLRQFNSMHGMRRIVPGCLGIGITPLANMLASNHYYGGKKSSANGGFREY
jgi:hypothetical protein